MNKTLKFTMISWGMFLLLLNHMTSGAKTEKPDQNLQVRIMNRVNERG